MKTILKSTFILFFLFTSSILLAQKKTETIVIKTSVVCDMCKERIEKNLIFEKGVKEVVVDISAKTITVKFKSDKTNADSIKHAIVKLGYRADDLPADPEAFKKLPDCCKKDGCGKD